MKTISDFKCTTTKNIFFSLVTTASIASNYYFKNYQKDTLNTKKQDENTKK